jgi:hypothetical protein
MLFSELCMHFENSVQPDRVKQIERALYLARQRHCPPEVFGAILLLDFPNTWTGTVQHLLQEIGRTKRYHVTTDYHYRNDMSPKTRQIFDCVDGGLMNAEEVLEVRNDPNLAQRLELFEILEASLVDSQITTLPVTAYQKEFDQCVTDPLQPRPLRHLHPLRTLPPHRILPLECTDTHPCPNEPVGLPVPLDTQNTQTPPQSQSGIDRQDLGPGE